MTSPHPAIDRMLDAMPYVTVRRKKMRDRGRYYADRHLVVIKSGLRGGDYFASVAHELIHAERGDTCCATEVLEAREEIEVEREAARRLIPIDKLIAALAWSRNDEELAHELDVDLDMLAARASCLTQDEIALINERLDSAEQGIA